MNQIDYLSIDQVKDALASLYQTIRTLRAPGGCPWDREQTHASLAHCLIEECAEVLEAVDSGDSAMMREEFGDLLLLVFMHTAIAEEMGGFTLAEAAAEADAKLVRRHPHVFEKREGKMSSEAVVSQWEAIKRTEKKSNGDKDPATSPFKDLPPRLPASLYALDIWKRMTRHRWVSDQVKPERVQCQAAEDEEALADRLFEIMAACREKGLDPEALLRQKADRVKKSARPADPADETRLS